MRKTNELPSGWDERRVREVLEHYENQSDEEAAAEHEAAHLADSKIEVAQIGHAGLVNSLQLRGQIGAGGPGTGYLLARVGRREAGVLTFFETESGYACHLHELFVAPRWRRRGVGSALVRRVLEISSERGYRRVTLLARPLGKAVSRALLKRWYERVGFEAVLGDPEEMQLVLPRRPEFLERPEGPSA